MNHGRTPTSENRRRTPLAAIPRATEPERRRASDVEAIRVIGQGTMGEVLFARDHELLRDVAYKRVRHASLEPKLTKHLEREARIAAQLDHPNIVPVHALQRGPGDQFGYVMKLVTGETFAKLLDRARGHRVEEREPDEHLADRLDVLMRVIDAVAYAHDKGVVHRDLKPSNVLIAQHGQVYLTDWGLAKVLKDRSPLAALSTVQIARPNSEEPTETHALIGTALYMSPEQANGRSSGLGPESDVYSLGLMLYEVLTLKHPYWGGEDRDVLLRIRQGEPRRDRVGPDRPDPELFDVAAKATAQRPEDRYADAGALASDLHRWLSGRRTQAARNTLDQQLRRWVRRRPDLGVAVVAFLLAADLVLLLVLLLR